LRLERVWVASLVGALLFVAARIVQRSTNVPIAAVWACRAEYALGIAFTAAASAAMQRQLGVSLRRPVTIAMFAFGAAMATIILATDLVIADQPVLRTDLIGSRYY